eukprot:767577-Hanusia_phi.AAC.4
MTWEHRQSLCCAGPGGVQRTLRTFDATELNAGANDPLRVSASAMASILVVNLDISLLCHHPEIQGRLAINNLDLEW